MFTINGNLTEFTQWEQGYSLTNPNMKAGDRVQFFSGAGDGSIMTAKEEGGVVLVEVPNIMLQHASNITARFVGGGDYTSFAVIGRKRPKDYVFIDNEYKEKEPTGGGGGNSTYNVEYRMNTTIEKEWYNGGKITKVDFPLVTFIGSYAFDGYNSLTEANIPNATGIGSYAFNNCTSLTEANFPLVTVIGNYAFNSCTSLTKANFPLVTGIIGNVFDSCTALTTADFPLVTSIGDDVFNGCTALTKADFPLVTNIGKFAFYGCDSLTTLIVRTSEICNIDVSSILKTKIVTEQGTPVGEGFIYVPSALLESYIIDFIPKIIALGQAFGMPIDEATATYIATMMFRPLEDYTVDGTTTGELDESKI